MAKKSFNISSTLKKNKEALEPKLPEKVVLKKKTRDFNEIKDKVEDIHQEEIESKSQEDPQPIKKILASEPRKVEPKTKAKPKNTVKEKMVRMTIDTPEGMHRKLKIKSIEKGVSMRDYILRLIEREIKKG